MDQTSNKAFDSLAKNTILLSFGTLLNKGLQFIMIPLYSRWLSTEDYGMFDLLCTYVMLLVPIITMASSEALFRFSVTGDSENDTKRYTSSAFAICLFNSVIAIVIIAIYAWKAQWTLAIPFSLLVVGEVFQAYLQGFMRGQKKINIYSFFSAITTLFIAIFSTIFVLAMDMGLAGLLYGYGVGYLVGDLSIVAVSNFKRYASPCYVSIKSAKDLISYSLPLVPNNISWWIISVSDRLIIQAFIGVAANGIYAIVAKIPNLCSAVFNMFNISWQQNASENVQNKHNIEYCNIIYNTTNRVVTSLCILLLSVNFILFDFIFDSKYTSGRYYSPILIIALIFSTLSNYMGGIQISLKQPKEIGITTVLGALTNVVINLIFVRSWGVYAACISTVIAQIVVYSFRRFRLPKEYKLKLEKENYIIMLAFVYFFAMEYMPFYSYFLKIANVLIACIVFFFSNRTILKNAIMHVSCKR